MEHDAVRPPAGFEPVDDHARLRIDDGDIVAVQLGGVEQAPVGREGDVAHEVVVRALGLGRDFESARRGEGAIGEGELEYRGLRATAHVHAVALGGKRQTEPAVGHRSAAQHASGFGVEHGDRRGIEAAVERQQVAAVGRKRRGHGQGVEGHLPSHGRHPPETIEQEAAVRERADAVPRSALGVQQGAH